MRRPSQGPARAQATTVNLAFYKSSIIKKGIRLHIGGTTVLNYDLSISNTFIKNFSSVNKYNFSFDHYAYLDSVSGKISI